MATRGQVTVERLGVAGAGTMGAGIAQLAAQGGFETQLHDPDPDALERGVERIRAGLAKGAAKGLWREAEAEAAAERLRTAPALDDLGDCDLAIEAAPEDLDLKRRLMTRLAEVCGARALLATNTSSLSVDAIAAELPGPERFCGLHFFNPPARMRLVEVVAGEHTAEATIAVATAVATAMGREPIRCADSPGFIVNRCNRPFTLEALRILGEGDVAHDQIDLVVREGGGYPMGPFELMDLIGIDVNLEVARSFYAQRAHPRWQPHQIQEQMVAEGRLGRKAGRGFYDYGEGARPPVEPPAPEVGRELLERIVCQLVNEAAFAAFEGVAERDDIDSAMRLGLNHPRGPFEWADELGPERVVRTLDSLRERHGRRYEAAPLLREMAAG
jgi:3-hydroxybutyryl-CoA dehydrogenase